MIELKNVSKFYGTTRVVDDVSLTLRRSGITSIIGANGAGKSTLLSMVSRVIPIDEGRVLVDEMDISTTPGDVLARRLSIMRQDTAINARLTVSELVAFGRYPYSKGRMTIADAEMVRTSIDFVDLTPQADRYIDQLSGGQRQRAFIAMVLCQDTEYVLFDEPLNNLDMKHAAATMHLLERLAREFGKTIIVVLHDINVAARFSDEIVAMRQGTVIHQGTPIDVVREDILHEVFDVGCQVHVIGSERLVVFW